LSVPIGTGAEASVTAGATDHVAVSMQYAPKTSAAGVTKTLVNCGLGTPGECPAGVSGNIALIQRGSISFGEKVANAMAQGAVAAIIYNNQPGQLIGTLGTPTAPGNVPWVPAVGVSDVTGAQLLLSVGNQATLKAIVSDWDLYDGTSMATPHVSGIVALIWGSRPALTNDQVETALFSTTTDLGDAGYDTLYGRGLVNAEAAIGAAAGMSRGVVR
jgi:serine protease